MSKSLGNLVFVSRLLAAGTEAAALRLALLGEHYRADREWTAQVLSDAEARLSRWRVACRRATGPSGADLLSAVRAAAYEDLDTPRALAAIDAWCDQDGDDADAPGLVVRTADALLGVSLS